MLRPVGLELKSTGVNLVAIELRPPILKFVVRQTQQNFETKPAELSLVLRMAGPRLTLMLRIAVLNLTLVLRTAGLDLVLRMVGPNLVSR